MMRLEDGFFLVVSVSRARLEISDREIFFFSAGFLRVWRCVSLRTIFLGFVSSVTVALLGLDPVVYGSWVSSAPLRVPLGSTEEARMVLFRVGSGLPCSRILWRCVLVLRSLAVSSSSWRVRLVATPRSRSGFVGVALLAAGSISLVFSFCSGSD